MLHCVVPPWSSLSTASSAYIVVEIVSKTGHRESFSLKHFVFKDRAVLSRVRPGSEGKIVVSIDSVHALADYFSRQSRVQIRLLPPLVCRGLLLVIACFTKRLFHQHTAAIFPMALCHVWCPSALDTPALWRWDFPKMDLPCMATLPLHTTERVDANAMTL